MPNDSTHANHTNRIQAACRELELALENFDQPGSKKTNETNLQSSPKPQFADNQLNQIHNQLLDIRRQLDELS